MTTISFDPELETRLRGPSRLIWLVCASVMIFVIWTAIAWVDQIVRGPGEVVSASRPQIIQNLEGGILAVLPVSEGDIVRPGDMLAQLQSTEFQAVVDDLSEQIAGLEIKHIRLAAEIAEENEMVVPRELANGFPAIVASEQALLQARLSDYASQREGARSVMNEAGKELELLENLLDRKVVALIEVTRARKAFSDARATYRETVSRMELDRATEYSATLQELTSLKQSLTAAQDKLNRTRITSPLHGVVNKLPITTIGGVVRPGEEIAQVIPIGDELLVEAQIPPKDIANVTLGLPANIKLSAFDYTIYGSLPAEVVLISADTFEDERSPQPEPFYRVSLRIDRQAMAEGRLSNVVLRPGMQAEVELKTGRKTILQYLTKPLYKSKQALSEP